MDMFTIYLSCYKKIERIIEKAKTEDWLSIGLCLLELQFAPSSNICNISFALRLLIKNIKIFRWQSARWLVSTFWFPSKYLINHLFEYLSINFDYPDCLRYQRINQYTLWVLFKTPFIHYADTIWRHATMLYWPPVYIIPAKFSTWIWYEMNMACKLASLLNQQQIWHHLMSYSYPGNNLPNESIRPDKSSSISAQ